MNAPKLLNAGNTDLQIRQAVLSNQILVPTKVHSIPNLAGVDRRFAVNPFEAEALYDFEAQTEDEVDLFAGDAITVSYTGGRPDCEDGWWYGNVRQRQGWFPGAFVKS